MTDDEEATAVVAHLARCTVCRPPAMCAECATKWFDSNLKTIYSRELLEKLARHFNR